MSTNLYRVRTPDDHASNDWAANQAKGVVSSYYPAVVQYYEKPNGPKKPVKMTPEMLAWVRTLQVNDDIYRKHLWIAGGIYNVQGNAAYIPKKRPANEKIYIPHEPPWVQPPVAQPVTSVGNVVNVLEVRNGWARIETVPMKGPWAVKPSTHPWLFNNPFTSIQVGGTKLGNAIDDRGVIWPLWASSKESWMPMSALEKYELPKEPAVSLLPKESRAWGVDISRWNSPFDGHVSNPDFVIAKASEGTGWYDPCFGRQDWQKIPDGTVWGAYHYYRSGQSALDQVHQFLSAVYQAEQRMGRKVQLLALDYENINNTLNAASDRDAQRIISELKSRQDRPVLLYTSPSELAAMRSRRANWMDGVDLWVAQWYSRQHFLRPTTLGPAVPNHRIWQYGGDYKDKAGWEVPGHGEGKAYGASSQHIDLNLYNGTRADLYAFVGATMPAEIVDLGNGFGEPLEAPAPTTGGGLTWAQKTYNEFRVIQRR